jgi:hypothetical protein
LFSIVHNLFTLSTIVYKKAKIRAVARGGVGEGNRSKKEEGGSERKFQGNQAKP